MSSKPSWMTQQDEEDDEDIRDDTEYVAQKDATLFAIEVSESMIAMPNPDEMDTDPPQKKRKTTTRIASSTISALQCAFDLMQKRIISNPGDLMGILLFGTEKQKFLNNPGSYPNCYLLTDLSQPNAETIKELKYLLESVDDLEDLLKPSKEPASMSSVLYSANHLFTTKASNFNSRRLFIVTDNDDPHTDKAIKDSAITRARDLYDLGVKIEPFFISKPGHAFDKSKFYDDIIYHAEGDDGEGENDISTDAATRFEDMRSAITAKQAPRRALFSSKVELAPGLCIGVKGYLLYKRTEPTRSHYIHEGGEKLQIVTGKTTQLADDTAQEVVPAEIKKAYKFGGEAITFTNEELTKNVRNFGEPVIRIIGFKPLKYLELWHNLKHSTFIYPSEESYTGSTRTFAALHSKMLKDSKMALAWFIARRNAAPVLAAMIPSEERIDLDSHQQITPPGLFLIPLPFLDDIRSNPEVPYKVAPNSLIDKMRSVIQQLHKPQGYIPAKYSNPALQKHYKVLQCIALEEELPEHFDDQTLPKYKLIDKHAHDKINEWGEELDRVADSIRETKIEVTGKKRGAAVDDAGPKKKAVKKEIKTEDDGGMDDKEIKKAYEGNTLNKFTVAVLKDWLEGKGLATAGKKADLLERVEEWCEKH